jgi:hypothetical protein
MVYVNTNDCERCTYVEPHHAKDLISHEHFVVLAPTH